MEGGLSRGLLRGYCSGTFLLCRSVSHPRCPILIRLIPLPGMATYGPFSAIYFGIYEQWKKICAGEEPLPKAALFVLPGVDSASVGRLCWFG
eukprot:3363309-Rhodomonas_salina.1